MRDLPSRLGAGRKTRAGAMILMLAAGALPSVTFGVEGGSSNWAMGVSGFGAGKIPDPGFHFANLTWFMDVSTNQDFTLGNNRVTSFDTEITVNFSFPTYAGKIDAWDARYKVMGVLPLVWIDARYRVADGPNVHGSKDYVFGDPGVEVGLGWHKDNWEGVDGLSLDHSVGLLVITPWGRYERNEVINPGKYRWTIQPYFAYTLSHEPTGIELSQRFMYSVNLKNDRTDYNSGDEFHFDWALGKKFGKGWQAGLFGYVYRQVTADDGGGATLGDLKGKGWGIGPIVQYGTEIGGFPVGGALRYQKVLQHRNRTDDDSLMFNFAVSF